MNRCPARAVQKLRAKQRIVGDPRPPRINRLLIRHFWRRWNHFHHASEELILVLGGEPTIRLRDGDRQLREGDVVPLPRGPSGGHQLRNESTAAARVLIVSTNTRPDVAEYPETGKVGL